MVILIYEPVTSHSNTVVFKNTKHVSFMSNPATNVECKALKHTYFFT